MVSTRGNQTRKGLENALENALESITIPNEWVWVFV